MESKESNQGKKKESSSEDSKDQQSESSLEQGNINQEELSGTQNSGQETEETGYSSSESISEAIPQEFLDQLPRKEREKMVSSLSIMMGNRQSSPIAKQINPDHITQELLSL